MITLGLLEPINADFANQIAMLEQLMLETFILCPPSGLGILGGFLFALVCGFFLFFFPFVFLLIAVSILESFNFLLLGVLRDISEKRLHFWK